MNAKRRWAAVWCKPLGLSFAIAAVLLIMAAGVAWSESPENTPRSRAVDPLSRQLVEAVRLGRAGTVTRLLRAGADPNASIGPQFDDKAFCLSMQPERKPILDLLIDAGADLNDMDPHGGAGANDPLTCAVFFYNVDAFDRLLTLGADPDQDLCPWCPEPYENSLLAETLTSRRFDLAWRVMQITSVDAAELKTLIVALEQFAIPDDDPGVGPREKIIEWVRERGIDVEPIELFELERRR